MSNAPRDIVDAVLWLDELVDIRGEQADQNALAQTAVLREIASILRQISTDIQNLSHTQQSIPTLTVQNTNIEHSPREKLSKKLLATADWIAEHDPDSKLSVRQVAQGAGVSIGTAQAAIKLVADEARPND